MKLKAGDIYSNADDTFLILLLRRNEWGEWRSLILGEEDSTPEYIMAHFGGFSGWLFVCSLDS
jgi:hypothetical protein